MYLLKWKMIQILYFKYLMISESINNFKTVLFSVYAVHSFERSQVRGYYTYIRFIGI